VGDGSHRGALTDAERAVVRHLSHGLTLNMVAETDDRPPAEVVALLRSAQAALNAKTRVHLVAIALRRGLIE
jgi:DNA-binding CsgD family transcriptional regulator